jgi:hypothetical protein
MQVSNMQRHFDLKVYVASLLYVWGVFGILQDSSVCVATRF